jgi:hypothetical protein
MNSREDGKFIEKRVSTVWLLCQRGKKAQFLVDPITKTFLSKDGDKV